MLKFRTQLLKLVLATVLPLAILATALAAWLAHERREDVFRGMDATAAAIQLALDSELRVTTATLQVLGASPIVDEAFGPEPQASAAITALHQQATETIARRPAELASILLHDGIPSRIRFNTLVPPGVPLPEVRALRYPPGRIGPSPNDAAIWSEIAATGLPRISDLIEGVVVARWLVAVAAPVMREGRMIGGLTATILPASIGAILRQQPLPPGWVLTVVDRGGIIVARSSGADRLVAMPATEPARNFQQNSAADAARSTTSRDGMPFYVSLRRLTAAPWAITYGAPAADVDAPLYEALFIAGGGALLAVLIAAAVALWLGARLGREIEGLVDDAKALVADDVEQANPATGGITEIVLVQHALRASAAALRAREKAKVEAEKHQIMLLREVDHRAKNALMVALAAVRMTPRNTSPAEFASTVEGRIASLAKAHSLLAATAWAGADLETVARGEVAVFGERVDLSGPRIVLLAAAVQPCAMVLHELATNAVKHGALAMPDGQIQLSWDFDDAGMVRVEWQEAGGPPLSGPPERTGFGSRLIHQMIAHQLGGALEMRWLAGGLRVTITLPPELVQTAVAGVSC